LSSSDRQLLLFSAAKYWPPVAKTALGANAVLSPCSDIGNPIVEHTARYFGILIAPAGPDHKSPTRHSRLERSWQATRKTEDQDSAHWDFR
jgi:hypothetical protein